MKITETLPKHDLKKGILLILCGWVCFSTLCMFSKLIGDQTSVPTMLFFRNVMGLSIILPIMIRQGGKSLKVNNIKYVALRSITGLLNLLFIFLAVEKISLVNTTLLNNGAPFFVPFILYFWLKVPINHKLWPAIFLGFFGITLILQPDKRIFDLGSLYALLSSLCLAVTLIALGLASQKEKLLNYLFYFFSIGIITSLPFAVLTWKIDSFATLIGLLAIGLSSLAVQFFFFNAMRLAKPHQLTPFTYSTVIFAGIYDWAIWGNVPVAIAYVGMALILASGIWIVYVNRPPRKTHIE